MKWNRISLPTGIVCLMLLFTFVLANVCSAAENTQSIDELWQIQAERLFDRYANAIVMAAAKETLIDYNLNNGVTLSPQLAAAYVVSAQKLVQQERYDAALWALESALEMDGGFIPAARGRIVVSFKKNIFSVFGPFLTSFLTYWKAFSNIYQQLILLGNLSNTLILTFLINMVILVTALVVRYSNLFHHEILERLPLKVPPKVIWIFVILILVLPFLLGFGVFWMFLWWLLLLSFYIGKRERTLLMLSYLFLFAILPLNVFRVAVLLAHDDGLIQVMAYTYHGAGYSAESIDRLSAHLDRSSSKAHMHFLKGMLYKRGGYYFDALKEYMEYTRIERSDAIGHLNLGNIYFILNNIGEAIAEYRKAENTDPNNAAIYCNLSKAYSHQFKFQQMDSMLKKANDLNPKLVSKFTDNLSSNPNRMLLDGLFPKKWIWQEFEQFYERSFAEQENHWRKLGPGLGMRSALTVLFSVFVIFLIIPAISKRMNVSRFCIKCGASMCPRCQKNSDSKKFCSHCQMMITKKGQVDPKDRDKNLRDVNTRVRRRKLTKICLTVLFPGMGAVYDGRLTSGFILALLWSFSLSTLITAQTWLPVSWLVPQLGQLYETVILISLMLIIYCFSLLLIIRETD
ncbi:tetratricopeptide repeat protein [bacterium]|nr:tetratricopeptide repeat protein [candidate division CSSED10-310 bacterium]